MHNNQTPKSVKVQNKIQGLSAEFLVHSDSVTTEKTNLESFMFSSMKNVAQLFVLASGSNIRKTWDQILEKLIQTTVL